MISGGCKVGICAEVQKTMGVELRRRVFMLPLEQLVVIAERVDIDLGWRRGGHGIVG